jgi:hypothetical protein
MPSLLSWCRELVDGGYDAWERAMTAAVEAAGAADPKHGPRLRLENYDAWRQGLQVGGGAARGGQAQACVCLDHRSHLLRSAGDEKARVILPMRVAC